MKYEIVGNILDSSGYAIHTRSLFNALAKTEDVKLSTMLNPNWQREVNDKELEAIKKEDDYERIRIIITHPIFWRVNCTNKRNWVYCIWEGDKVPKSFIEEMLNPEIEKILVASEHTKKAINNSIDVSVIDKNAIISKIIVVNHGVDHSLFYPKISTKEKFTFLVNKGWRHNQDRGGTQYAVEAYIKEFTNKDPVRMIVKINPAYGIPNVNELLKEFAGDRNDVPEIMIDVGLYDYKQLNELYNKADVFVAATRAEAFGIPILEAMSCGLPVIVTGYSGPVDFVRDKIDGLYIDFDMEEVKHELQYESISWAKPKIDDLRKKLRYAFENKEEMKKMAEQALQQSKNYNWEKTAKLIIDSA